MHTIAVIFAGILCTTSVLAQDTNPAATDAFRAYFAPFLKGEWVYRIHLSDKDGNTVFDGEDYRSYRMGVRDRFIIEDVYAEEEGKRVHTAIQLIGLNPKTGGVDFSAFWPWQSTSIMEMRATLSIEDGIRRLRGVGVPAGQDFPRIHLACEFKDETRMDCTTEGELEDGTRFDRSKESFTRR